ncbi:glycoside hydrolase family 3 N-terminal domain-containing protein [Xanthovirga aplysinae]|uniref:glycoside hydrolase family 3 N-terminal domain-containing protein n=1 Tax=Xanthovirga aplysinae TaxID=2529853 RepID=UPI0012BC3486|nr:glycoside hydrolase family 3 N-terminal domain-containing protein [Xanthovirga aplysinae]MTI30768.1 glycosyl hydrolase [Xanthovirga aplysinae]
MPKLRVFCFYLFSITLSSNLLALKKNNLPIVGEQKQWVDSVFNSLNEDQRIGQLFMVAAYSNRDEKHYQTIENLIKTNNIGGLIFFQGGPVRQAQLTNRYQAAAKTPLLVAMDAEWGLGMRLDSTISYPRQMALGAIQDNQSIYDMGAEIARQCKRLGVHINFAPVIDVNSNPANPVIGNRSFGENKINVAEKGVAYMKGLQENGVIASAKHFPGHGDTSSDSHLTLPVVKKDVKSLDELELYPFKRLIQEGIKSIMVAHLYVPAYDKTPNQATTLSKKVVTKLLKKEMGFEGLVFTDALNMKGVSKFYAPGEVDVKALLAGNDILLFSENVPTALKMIKKAIKDKKISKKEIARRVKKILVAKYWAGLNHYQPINLNGLYEDLNSPEAQLMKQKLYKRSMTVVKNNANLLPIKVLDTTYFASLSIRSNGKYEFEEALSNYAPFSHYKIDKGEKGDQVYYQLLNNLENYQVVIVGVEGMNSSPSKNYGLQKKDLEFLRKLNKKTEVIVCVFGNAYSLKEFEDFDQLICTYQDDPVARQLVPQLVFGAMKGEGKLPVTASEKMREGAGISTLKLNRLGYSLPESEEMSSFILGEIDGIMEEAIKNRATPGGQVLIVRNGTVIFEKPYGYLTYDSLVAVNKETIYDVASVTKVAATLQSLMFLYGNGMLELNKTLGDYLPELKETNKSQLVLNEVLTHQAGLKPYIPFWRYTVNDKMDLDTTFYSNSAEGNFPNELMPGLYASGSLPDSVWSWVVNSELRRKKGKKYDYKYSDMGFYMLEKLVSTRLNQPMEEFLEQNFYAPLGMASTSYQPLCYFPLYRIAPTEVDNYFRNTLVHGTVHDPGAAMYGGVAGHAGLFSDANDLAKLLQMNLQDGNYGGVQYLMPGTVPKFSKKQFEDNRRGLGWDKPTPAGEKGPTSDDVSESTYGHTGFTGTGVWVDPKYNLVYIFLSNRIYPDAGNIKLIRGNIRTRIQHVIYKAIINRI